MIRFEHDDVGHRDEGDDTTTHLGGDHVDPRALDFRRSGPASSTADLKVPVGMRARWVPARSPRPRTRRRRSPVCPARGLARLARLGADLRGDEHLAAGLGHRLHRRQLRPPRRDRIIYLPRHLTPRDRPGRCTAEADRRARHQHRFDVRVTGSWQFDRVVDDLDDRAGASGRTGRATTSSVRWTQPAAARNWSATEWRAAAIRGVTGGSSTRLPRRTQRADLSADGQQRRRSDGAAASRRRHGVAAGEQMPDRRFGGSAEQRGTDAPLPDVGERGQRRHRACSSAAAAASRTPDRGSSTPAASPSPAPRPASSKSIRPSVSSIPAPTGRSQSASGR